MLDMDVLFKENDGLVVIFRLVDSHILRHISMKENRSLGAARRERRRILRSRASSLSRCFRASASGPVSRAC